MFGIVIVGGTHFRHATNTGSIDPLRFKIFLALSAMIGIFILIALIVDYIRFR